MVRRSSDADAIAKRTAELLRPMMEAMIEAAEKKLLERMGLDPAKIGEVQRDFAFIRCQRELKEAVVRQGIIAVVGMMIVGIVTAVGFWFRSGAPK